MVTRGVSIAMHAVIRAWYAVINCSTDTVPEQGLRTLIHHMCATSVVQLSFNIGYSLYPDSSDVYNLFTAQNSNT